VMRLPGPVVDGYLAHPLVGASLRQHVGRQRLRLAIVLCMIAVEVCLLVTGVPPWWVLLLTVPAAGLLVGVVDMLAIRRNLLAADRRAAALFGPAFMVPALEFMQANPPTVKGLVRLLMKGLPTPSQRLARLGHGPATPAGAQRSRPD
jgi:hypothetical protein